MKSNATKKKTITKEATVKPRKTKSTTVEHMTISIPPKLKQRMLEFQARYRVNWSRLSRKAFLRHMEIKENGKE